VFGDLGEAEAFARQEVASRPELRCTIYDHRGMVGRPLQDIRGSEFKGERDFTPRVRRWLGAILFFGGLILITVDWFSDWSLLWPAMIGVRTFLPGLVLLFTDPILAWSAKLHQRRAAKEIR
jgi:hypothetical protein